MINTIITKRKMTPVQLKDLAAAELLILLTYLKKAWLSKERGARDEQVPARSGVKEKRDTLSWTSLPFGRAGLAGMGHRL